MSTAVELLVQVVRHSEELAQVRDLWRSERAYLGFLPDAGFDERADRGTLLASVYGGRVRGYVLYDLPADLVKIVHLCVAKSDRGFGVARRLVQELSTRHSERRGVLLSCRRDWPAANAWPKLGFAPVGERRGRSRSGEPLTQWYRDHGHPNLFSILEASREAAALDHNILNDLSSTRSEGSESRLLAEAWLSEYVELCVTDEVHHEIHEASESELRRRLHVHASSFRRLAPPAADWKPLTSSIANLIPSAQPADHRHIARAIAGGASFFVTRDQGVLRGAQELGAAYDITVLRPEALIATIDRRRASGAYEPVALEATAISVEPAANLSEQVFAEAFLNFGAGERKGSLLAIFRAATASTGRVDARVFSDGGGRPLAALFIRRHDGQVEVPLMRVATRDRVGEAIARQLAYMPRLSAAQAGSSQVVVTDTAISPAVQRALRDEAYDESGGGARCTVTRGLIHADTLDSSARNASNAAAIERRHWPLKVVGAGLATYLVPIRATWAAQLFETRLAEATLFGRETHLGLSREHVYYRNPANAHGIHAPARILWYVTGSGPAQRESHIRALSQLVEVVIDDWRTLYRRFARLGVYEERQVRAAADPQGQVIGPPVRRH